MILLRPIRFITALLLVILTAQCSSKESVLAPKIASLVGTWQLIQPDSSYAITLQFALDTDHPPKDVTPFLATGKSSVNDYNIRLFATIDGMMVADELGSTKIAGSANAQQVEQTYFDNLKNVVQYELPTANHLHLLHGGQQPGTLVYQKIQ